MNTDASGAAAGIWLSTSQAQRTRRRQLHRQPVGPADAERRTNQLVTVRSIRCASSDAATAGVRLFDVGESGFSIVSVVRIDEQEAPENDAEEAILEEMLGRDSPQTAPDTPPDRDDPPPTDTE
ncbi:MAG: hypothetical protein R3D83_09240 [Caenibius sp.]